MYGAPRAWGLPSIIRRYNEWALAVVLPIVPTYGRLHPCKDKAEWLGSFGQISGWDKWTTLLS